MRWIVIAGLAALVVGIILLPLRLAVSSLAPGLEADAVTGSIWKGELRAASWDGVPLGDLDIGLDFRSLLGGKLELSFTRLNSGANGLPLNGVVGGSSDSKRISGLDGELQLAVLPAPLPGVAFSFANVSASFSNSRGCMAAGGTITARVSGIPLLGDSPPISGTPRCEGEALLTRLAAPTAPLALDLWLWQDGRYRAGLAVQTANPLTRIALERIGFTPTSEGAILLVEGIPGKPPLRVQG